MALRRYTLAASPARASPIGGFFAPLPAVAVQAQSKEFDIRKLSRMRSINPVLRVFNNTRKANSFLSGSKKIAQEGFSVFKRRLKTRGVDMLQELPGLGPITKFHLAKNIGLVDAAKPDIWLERSAQHCSSTVDELVTYLSDRYGMSQHVVDVILWHYGADKGLGLMKKSSTPLQKCRY